MPKGGAGADVRVSLSCRSYSRGAVPLRFFYRFSTILPGPGGITGGRSDQCCEPLTLCKGDVMRKFSLLAAAGCLLFGSGLAVRAGHAPANRAVVARGIKAHGDPK